MLLLFGNLALNLATWQLQLIFILEAHFKLAKFYGETVCGIVMPLCNPYLPWPPWEKQHQHKCSPRFLKIRLGLYSKKFQKCLINYLGLSYEQTDVTTIFVGKSS
jgi:hypothetical protein